MQSIIINEEQKWIKPNMIKNKEMETEINYRPKTTVIKFKTKEECDLFIEYTDKKDFIKRCNNDKGCVLRVHDSEKISLKLELGECPVCLNDKKLKILNCNHKLCLDCLDRINLHNKLENICPLCQHEL